MVRKQIVTAIVVAMLISCAFPGVCLAADHPLGDEQSLDISTCAEGDTITVAAGASVTVTGSRNNTRINCGEGVSVTLSGVTIDDSAATGFCPLAFTGAGNTLILAEETTNTLTAGQNKPAVFVETGTELAISGGGTLNAKGGEYGAGIGGGNFDAGTGGGKITISGAGEVNAEGGQNAAGIGGNDHASGGTIEVSGTVEVNAKGGEYGAGIGGGYYYGAGNVLISSGTVNANSGRCGAGIGSGFYAENGGDIRITGGTVNANGIGGGAGLGGGYATPGGTIKIEGGKVTATSAEIAAGIGGGCYEGTGDIDLSGGIIFATGNGGNDIGCYFDYEDTTGSLSISGSAAVFLTNDSCITPDTTTHNHFTDNKSYGVAMPAEFTTFGAWLRMATLSYSSNGGSGAVPDPVTQATNATLTVREGSALSRTYYTFDGWNTAADSSGASYDAGEPFTLLEHTTLYAQWLARPELSSSVTSGTVYTGGRITLTPNIEGGEWDWDEAFFSATFNSPATFRALKTGTSTITYTVDGVSVSYAVTIKQSKLPDTGQDYIWIYILCGLGIFAAAGAFSYRKYTAKVK